MNSQTNTRRTEEQQPGLNIYVNGVNTFLSQAIVEELRNDNVMFDSNKAGEHKIYGTMSESENSPVPQGLSKVIPKNRKKLVYESILSSDVAIFDLNFGSPDEIDQVVKMMKEREEQLEVTIVVISSLMSWAGTPPKLAKEQTGNESEDEGLSKEEVDRKYTADFIDEDFQSRMPSTRFAKLKHVENQVLQLRKFQPKVNTYLICTGILYGNGEGTLYDHFRMAWIGTKVPLLGEGFNYIPTIHVVDVARIVKKVIFENPLKSYIIAVDYGMNTQRELIEAIAGGKQDKINVVDILDVYSESWTDYLNVDIRMRPSLMFDKRFKWHCKGGIPAHITKLQHEFALFQNFDTIKVLVSGHPLSGKTQVSQSVAEYLNINTVSAREATDFCLKLEGAFGDEVRQAQEQLRDQMVEELEKQRKKLQEGDREHMKVKFQNKILANALKTYIKEKDYSLKGYVLDNAIKNAKVLDKFIHLKEKRVEEKKTMKRKPSNFEIKVKTKLQEYKIDLAFFLEAPKEVLQQRILQATPAQKEANPHLTDPELQRRLAEYESNQASLVKQLQAEKVKVITIKVEGKSIQEISEEVRNHISSHYRFLVYLHANASNEKIIIEKLLREEAEKEEQREEEEKNQAKEATIRTKQVQKVNQRLDRIKEKKQQLLDTRSLPIRQYLLDKVLPTVTESLITYLAQIDFSQLQEGQEPEVEKDPIEHLADILEAKGQKMDDEIQEEKRRKEEERQKMLEELRKKNESDNEYDDEDLSNSIVTPKKGGRS